MTQRIQKARSREEFEREERLASETLGGTRNRSNAGTKVGGAGAKRNVAPEAHNPEQQDYDEENLGMLGGSKETGETEAIQAGTYEDDYGVGVQGRREQGQVGETKDPEKEVLKRGEKTVGGRTEDQEDFPTGKWSRQKARARLSSTPRNAKATKTGSSSRSDSKEARPKSTRGRRSDETGSVRSRGRSAERSTRGRGTSAEVRSKPSGSSRGARTRSRSGDTVEGTRTKTASSGAAGRRRPGRDDDA